MTTSTPSALHRQVALLRAARLPLLIAALCIALAAGGESVQALLRYDRQLILEGQVWRLLSAHLVHLGWSHLWLNLGGLALVWALVGERFSERSWLVVLLIDALVTGLGLLILNPDLRWYVGLSGVLHGLLVAGIVADLRLGLRGAWLLLALLALKLGWEQLAGPLPGSAASAGGRVIVDAHLYGALGGLLMGLVLPLRRPPQASPSRSR